MARFPDSAFFSHFRSGGVPVGDMTWGQNSFSEPHSMTLPEDMEAARGVNLRAVLLDTQGPEIRTGLLAGDGGKTKIQLQKDEMITLTTDERFREIGDASKIYVTYKDLARSVQPTSTVLLDDGAVSLEVVRVDVASGEVECRVHNTP